MDDPQSKKNKETILEIKYLLSVNRMSNIWNGKHIV